MIISQTAILAGAIASLLFLIVGAPLANAVAIVKLSLGPTLFNMIIAMGMGIAAAPIAERHSPELNQVASKLERFVQKEILSRI